VGSPVKDLASMAGSAGNRASGNSKALEPTLLLAVPPETHNRPGREENLAGNFGVP
jgi:hypothetical protein